MQTPTDSFFPDATKDRERFYDLPALTAEEVEGWRPTTTSRLMLLDYSSGNGIVFEVDYVHTALTYRTPGRKDAMANGTARLEGDSEWREVRIYFSRPHQTAALRGLALEGQVRLAG